VMQERKSAGPGKSGHDRQILLLSSVSLDPQHGGGNSIAAATFTPGG
jgi:hypothetical protein